MMQGKRVLVTGGAGFLGSHLCERLLALGHHVFCLDSFETGRMENISYLMGHRGFRFIKHDVIEPLELRVDEIYNLACPASPVHYQADPIHTLKTSVYGSIHLLDLAARRKARILQASTSEVYGDPKEHPQQEDYWGNVNPNGIRACYDEGKRCAETLFFDYHRRCGVEIKIARIFNTYGPRMDQDDGRVISNFIVQALQNQPITVYGDGRQTRSFCFVKDMIDGLLALMESPADLTGPLNLGNPHEVTVLHLADRVLLLTESKSHITFKPLPQDDPIRRQPDISRARASLLWQPRTDLNTGLRATIDYFRRLLEESLPSGQTRKTAIVEEPVRLAQRVIPIVEERRAAAP
ncbi:MAG: UDP-glucuronic acid decarboxylase family protein [Phycisphaerales bacterium]